MSRAAPGRSAPPVRERYARKRFGQHFLHDRAVIRRIVDAIEPKPDDLIVEIGPGRGALTFPLLASGCELHAVEIDRDLAARLRARAPHGSNLVVHQADALELDLTGLAPPPRPLRVTGNLPYNISTPLVFRLLAVLPQIRDMHLMLQREVVDRMVSPPGTRAYGRLSVMVQIDCEVERVLQVGSGAFAPPPRVESAVVRLRPPASCRSRPRGPGSIRNHRQVMFFPTTQDAAQRPARRVRRTGDRRLGPGSAGTAGDADHRRIRRPRAREHEPRVKRRGRETMQTIRIPRSTLPIIANGRGTAGGELSTNSVENSVDKSRRDRVRADIQGN